jgi:rhamnosyltransferase
MKLSVALIIPTLNAGPFAASLVDAVRSQTRQPDAFLVIDSGSTDGTPEVFRAAGAAVRTIQKSSFDHGGTRQEGIDALLDAQIIIFLTQDAIPATRETFERLVACFDDPDIAAAYGRQLPRNGAGPVEAHARMFNYPLESRVRVLADRDTLGIKTAFISNSFSAWRRSDLAAVGGFPRTIIMGEDTYAAARLLLAGKKIAYCADATVLHSHDYSAIEEFKRYFDTGVLHAQESWIRDNFGGAGNEGVRFVKSELKFLLGSNPFLIPSAILRSLLKLLGFNCGLHEKALPIAIKRRLTMFPHYWSQDTSNNQTSDR